MGRGAVRFTTGVGVATALLALVLPGSVTGSPEARRHGVRAEEAGIDVDRVVDRLRHRITPLEGEPGTLHAVDDAYRARFDDAGFSVGDLGIDVEAASRVDDATALTVGHWRAEANIATRPLGNGMSERVTVREGEVEWDVVLDRPVRGEGGVSVVASMRGMTADAVRDGRSWRLTTAAGGLVLGEVVVRDAGGHELHRAMPRVQRDRLELRVPGSVLRRASYPLTIDPTVGPERRASGPSGIDGKQGGPSVASDGTDYLVVWEDFRNAQDTSEDIFATRVSRAGTILDTAGFPVSTAPNQQQSPDVAWNGSTYLVVWSDHRSGVLGDIWGARVTNGGTVLDPSGKAISTATGQQDWPAVASNGSDFMVTWDDHRSQVTGHDIWAQKVRGTDGVATGAALAVSTANAEQQFPDVAWTGTQFFMVWMDSRNAVTSGYDVYGARTLSTGGIGPSTPISTAPRDQRSPDIAWAGTTGFVVWDDDRTLGQVDVYGSRLTDTGVVLDPGGRGVATTSSAEGSPSIAPSGDGFQVVWTETGSTVDPEVFGRRVRASDGQLQGSKALLSGAAEYYPFRSAVAANGTGALVFWEANPYKGVDSPPSEDLFGATIDGSGAVTVGGIVLAGPGRHQREPAVALGGANALVVWEEDRAAGSSIDLFAARLRLSDGAILDGYPISVAMAAGEQVAPAVAWDGTDFVVIWQDNRTGGGYDIYGVRIGSDGNRLLTEFAVSTATGHQVAPALAADGNVLQAVWQDGRHAATSQADVFGSKISTTSTSTSVTSNVTISGAAPGNQLDPTVATDGTSFLVAWSDNRTASTASDIYRARITSSGVQGAVATVTAAGSQVRPSMAWGGNGVYLLVWEAQTSGTADVDGLRLDAAGFVIGSAFAVNHAAGTQDHPVAVGGGSFLVAWRDRRGSTYDIYATRITGDGGVEDGDGFPVAATVPDEEEPALALGSGDGWTVAYDRFVSGSSYAADRVFLRAVSPK